MEQAGVGVSRELSRHRLDLLEDTHEIGLRVRRRDRGDGGFQFDQFFEEILVERIHGPSVAFYDRKTSLQGGEKNGFESSGGSEECIAMVKRMRQRDEGPILGIECGGTRTRAVLWDEGASCLERKEFGPGNYQLLEPAELTELFATIGGAFPTPKAVGVGMAGIRTANDRGRVREAMARVWPGVRQYVTDDLETILAGVELPSEAPWSRVVVISGTGSCCFGRGADGQEVKVGGWGQRLGDQAGAYGISVAALRWTTQELDYRGKVAVLLQDFVRELRLRTVDRISDWAARASKGEMARLAPLVFTRARQGDPIAKRVIHEAADGLVNDALACVRRLGRRAPVQIILTGGCFQNQPAYLRRVRGGLRRRLRDGEIVLAQGIGPEGAARLAALRGRVVAKPVKRKTRSLDVNGGLPQSTALSPTERRHPGSHDLDRLSVGEGIAMMLREDRGLPSAIGAEAEKIERVIRWTVRAFRGGGRLIYFGAGTSGRLGVLDASECPPTFRTEPERVQGCIAGGLPALWRSIEGAEDRFEGGRDDVERHSVGANDVVVGIAASGRTPYVWGALGAAKAVGAKTVLLCFNPHLKFPRGMKPGTVICPEIGPEILTGSTRLKAGTATKMILNMITTLSMVQCGKVIQNLMIDLNPSNLKLRERAVRILQQLTRCSEGTAAQALQAESWVVKKAFRRLQGSPQGRDQRN